MPGPRLILPDFTSRLGGCSALAALLFAATIYRSYLLSSAQVYSVLPYAYFSTQLHWAGGDLLDFMSQAVPNFMGKPNSVQRGQHARSDIIKSLADAAPRNTGI